jgi:hypothetical protein
MEAAVAKKEAGMTEWNDGRLDDLSKRVDDGFARMDRQFELVHEDIRALQGRFDALQRTVVSGMLAALIGFIATQI